MSSTGGAGLVLVEFEYQYKGRDGTLVTIKPNERYVLLAKTNDHWWHVRRDARSKPFYIPAKYVKELPADLPSPLDFARLPGPEPKQAKAPGLAAVESKADEVTIRLRSPKAPRATENRMSTFGVPQDLHEVHAVEPKNRLSLSPGVLLSSWALAEEPAGKPRVPSFSPVDPVPRHTAAKAVEPPMVKDTAALSEPREAERSLEATSLPTFPGPEPGPEPDPELDSENIYESILDLKLSESPVADAVPVLVPASEPLAEQTSPSPADSQVEIVDPNTAVYANVADIKKRAPQSPPLASSASSSSSTSSSSKPSKPPQLDQEGWEEHTDQESGNKFYYHPVTGHTTWDDPRNPPPPAEMEPPKVILSCSSPGLSPGYSPALSLSSSRGSDWEQVMDEASGRHYYYNPTSGATSWEVPEPESPSSPVSDPQGPQNVHQDSPPPLPEEDYPTDNLSKPDSSSALPQELLPPVKQVAIPRASLDHLAHTGWSHSLDQAGNVVFTSDQTQEQWIRSEDEHGKSYYYLRDGSRSQWNLPEVEAPVLPSQSKEGNGLDQDGFPVMKNWRHSVCPAQLASAPEDMVAQKFFPKHKRNVSDHTSEGGSFDSSLDLPPVSRERVWTVSTPHHHRHTHMLEKAGILNKTKVLEHGKRLRKNWSQSWTVLHGGILTFHKDPKFSPAGHATKTSQIIPEHTLELRGASLSWAPKDKSSKKHVLELKTRRGCEYLVQYDTESIIKDWHKIIHDTIRQLDQDYHAEGEVKAEEPPEKSPVPPVDLEKRRNSTRHSSTSSITADSEQGRVRNKLRKFLQRRPTLQAVREKGYIRDIVFGCHLDTLCHRENTTVPRFVEKCIQAVERRGLDIDGIYRVSGNLAVIQKLRHKADQEEDLDLEDGQWEEIHVITGALKLFLRELAEPLFPYSVFDKFIAAIKIPDYNQKVSYMCDLVRSLPLPNHDTMQHLFRHLLKVIEYREVNRMSVQSVAIVFGPTLLRPQEESANITMHMVFQNQIVELLLNEFQQVFGPG